MCWLQMQASTSGSQYEHQNRRRSSSFGQQQEVQPQEKQQEQTTKWDFRVMTYNILAEGLVSHCTLFACLSAAQSGDWNYHP